MLDRPHHLEERAALNVKYLQEVIGNGYAKSPSVAIKSKRRSNLHARIHETVGVCVLVPVECQEVYKVEIEKTKVSCIENISKGYDINHALCEVRSFVLVNEKSVNPGIFETVEEEHNFHDDHED